MIVETKAEREARGHPVGVDVPYQAMGGLTGYSSLAEGYMRLDPSGRGAPSEEWLGQEITASDNTFLRAAVPSIQAHRRALKGKDLFTSSKSESESKMVFGCLMFLFICFAFALCEQALTSISYCNSIL